MASITSATPKIANYKFTTLNPNLGVAVYDNKEITLADIPGLIEGAHTGIGLGIKFLKHIERCKTLIHLIDITEENIENLYKQVRNELGKYSKNLLKKDELIVFNKIDAYTFMPKEEDDLTPILPENIPLEELRKTWMSKSNGESMFISALNKTHLADLKDVLYAKIKQLHEVRYPYNNFLY